MATLLDALNQENLDNQRERGQEREALELRQPALRPVVPQAAGPSLSAGAPLPPSHDRLDGGSGRGLAGGRLGLLPDLLRAQQRRADDRRGRGPGAARAGRRALLRRHSGGARRSRRRPTCRCRRSGWREARSRWRTACHCRATTSASGRRCWAIRGSTRWTSGRRSWPGARAAGLHKRLVREEKLAQDVALFSLGFVGGASDRAGQATVRPGVEADAVERAFEEELERLGREPVTADETGPRQGPDRDHASWRRCSGWRSGPIGLSMYATLLDDPDMVNRQLGRYLAVTPEAIREVAAEVFRPDNRVVVTYVPGNRLAAADEDRGRGGRGMTLEETLAVRPTPGQPRDYTFPPFERIAMPLRAAGADRPRAGPAADVGQRRSSATERPTSRPTWPARRSWRHGR